MSVRKTREHDVERSSALPTTSYITFALQAKARLRAGRLHSACFDISLGFEESVPLALKVDPDDRKESRSGIASRLSFV